MNTSSGSSGRLLLGSSEHPVADSCNPDQRRALGDVFPLVEAIGEECRDLASQVASAFLSIELRSLAANVQALVAFFRACDGRCERCGAPDCCVASCDRCWDVGEMRGRGWTLKGIRDRLRAERATHQAKIDAAYWAFSRTKRGKPCALVVPEAYREVANINRVLVALRGAS